MMWMVVIYGRIGVRIKLQGHMNCVSLVRMVQ